MRRSREACAVPCRRMAATTELRISERAASSYIAGIPRSGAGTCRQQWLLLVLDHPICHSVCARQFRVPSINATNAETLRSGRNKNAKTFL